ncbi:DUF2521 family protein [Bacillus sp. 2205SS5-2]|uniref:DUF2521 family protein n=1 Tax=Bacillus sp. 2205SS5-2 TaxID=3109031 RepID=UPI0030052407
MHLNVITTLNAKRREKQIKYERRLLKEISIKMLSESVRKYFNTLKVQGGIFMQEGFDEACYDVAIESYLLGGKVSRLGRNEDRVSQIKLSVESELKHLTDTIFNFWLYWAELGVASPVDESFYYACEQFVNKWWEEGYQKGIQRQKLRLH